MSGETLERMTHCRYSWASSLPPQNRSSALRPPGRKGRETQRLHRAASVRETDSQYAMENLGPNGQFFRWLYVFTMNH